MPTIKDVANSRTSRSRPFQGSSTEARSLAMRYAKKCCAPLRRLNAGPPQCPSFANGTLQGPRAYQRRYRMTPFAGRIIQGAEEASWRNGMLLLILHTGGDRSFENAAIQAALERKSRALFLRRCTIAPWSAGSRLGERLQDRLLGSGLGGCAIRLPDPAFPVVLTIASEQSGKDQ